MAGYLQQILTRLVDNTRSQDMLGYPHNIRQIDSRMWNPEWNRTYGKSYNTLFDVFNDTIRNPNKAYTVASNESYWWGARGGTPSGVLKKFSNMEPRKVLKRIRKWFRAMGRGQTLEDLIFNFLRAVADPGQAMEQQVAPDD